MRKFFSILLCFALIFSLAFSASATDLNDDLLVYNGTVGANIYKFIPENIFTSHPYYFIFPQSYSLWVYFYDSPPTAVVPTGSTIDNLISQTDLATGYIVYKSSDVSQRAVKMSDSQLTGNRYVNRIIFSNFDLLYSDGSVALHSSEAGSYLCDGSSCSVVDTDQDEICDTCGYSLAYSLRDTSYNYNGVSLPPIEVPSEYPYVILTSIESPGIYTFYLTKEPFYFEGDKLRYADDDYHIRISYNGGNVNQSEVTHLADGLLTYKENVIWSSYNIKDITDGSISVSGDPNFIPPRPLTEIPVAVMGEQMMITLPALGGTIRLLVLCGITLLGLLMALVLLPKILNRFLAI